MLYSATPEIDFNDAEKTSVFYHHRFVERFDDYDAMIASLLEKETL